MHQNKFKIQRATQSKKVTQMTRYQELFVGSQRLSVLIKYELIMLLCSWIPGALGYFLRSKLYPKFLGKVGKDVVFGLHVTFRHPSKIYIGNSVIIDDNVLIDAKGNVAAGITIGDEVFIGRNSILSCKGGKITLSRRANIGFNCVIFSSNSVHIGKDTLIAAYTYIIGGGNYHTDRTDIPMALQPDFEGKGGVVIDDDVWLGAHSVILDGVIIGSGSVVAAGAVVTNTVSAMTVVAGIPAQVLRKRTH